MAPHLSFLCGSIGLGQLVVEDVLNFLASSPVMHHSSLQNSAKARVMVATARISMSHLALLRPWTLMEASETTRYRGSSIPRDRLSALLDIVKARHKSFLAPDCCSSDAELYLRWAAHNLEQEQPSMCLSLAYPSRSFLGKTLPRLIPDLEAANLHPCIAACVGMSFSRCLVVFFLVSTYLIVKIIWL